MRLYSCGERKRREFNAQTKEIEQMSSTKKPTIRVKGGKKQEAQAPAAQAPEVAAPAKLTAEDRREKVLALCAMARQGYNGPSLSVRVSGKLHPFAVYVDRVTNPRKGAKGETERDRSQMAVIRSELKEDGTFDPSTFPADLSVVERLSCLGYVVYKDGKFSVTDKFLTSK